VAEAADDEISGAFVIHVGDQVLDEAEVQAVADVVRSGWLTQGARVAEFETAFAKVVGTAHAVAVSNGTVALHLTLVAMGVGQGDEVIVPATTFIATVNAVKYTGATPVIVDVDPDTYCMSPVAARKAVTGRTVAILPVHVFGAVADMPALQAVADDNELTVVEDAAESLGAYGRSRHTGAMGLAGTFSFYGNKTITTGEGGMVVTDDAEFAETLRLYRGQGQTPGRRYWHHVVGYNYRLTEMQAAIGLAQLIKLPMILRRLAEVAAQYQEFLGDAVTFQSTAPGTIPGNWMVAVNLHRAAAPIAARLEQQLVETRPMFPPIHLMPMYADGVSRPVAEGLYETCLVLPTHTNLTRDDVRQVSETLLWATRSDEVIR
jgi:perosamine synthetase